MYDIHRSVITIGAIVAVVTLFTAAVLFFGDLSSSPAIAQEEEEYTIYLPTIFGPPQIPPDFKPTAEAIDAWFYYTDLRIKVRNTSAVSYYIPWGYPIFKVTTTFKDGSKITYVRFVTSRGWDCYDNLTPNGNECSHYAIHTPIEDFWQTLDVVSNDIKIIKLCVKQNQYTEEKFCNCDPAEYTECVPDTGPYFE